MSRKYTRLFSDNAFAQRIPNAQPSVAIGVTQMRTIRVKAPSEGRITDLSIKQEETDGVQVAFEAEVLKSVVPWPLIDQDFPTATAANDSVTLYRAVPKQIGAAGFPIEFDEENLGYAYRNMDGNYTNNQRFIYILLAPGGVGVGAGTITNWKISMTIESDVG